MRANVNFFILMLLLIQLMHGVFAKSYIISPIPPPKSRVLDLDIRTCDEVCLNKAYENGEIFTFVSKFSPKITDETLRARLANILNQYNLIVPNDFFKLGKNNPFKIALLAPKDIIGRYANRGISTILAYLTNKNANFVFEIFDSKNEDAKNLQASYKNIQDQGFKYVIAILTKNGANTLLDSTALSLPTFIPTVNRGQIDRSYIPENIFFGGIDYDKQLSMLRQIAQNDSVVFYNDDSSIGKDLAQISESKEFNTIHKKVITMQYATRFSKQFEFEQNLLEGSTLLLNIPVIKTGLILSQLDGSPKMFLSTQINYNPSLLLLIKPKNRQNFYVVNAIGRSDYKLAEGALLLGSDLKFDWVSYSIAVGLEMLYQKHSKTTKKSFSEILENSQIQYRNHIFKTTDDNFIEIGDQK